MCKVAVAHTYNQMRVTNDSMKLELVLLLLQPSSVFSVGFSFSSSEFGNNSFRRSPLHCFFDTTYSGAGLLEEQIYCIMHAQMSDDSGEEYTKFPYTDTYSEPQEIISVLSREISLFRNL